ncbi:MAG: class I SAM-dependent methyltransferase [Sphingobacteriales bacterium]
MFEFDIGMVAKEARTIKTDFEELYFAIRQGEKRIYTDDQLRMLPDIDPLHIHAAEWKIRKRSCMHLLLYLFKKHKSLRILEVGCGNGWLSSKLADIPGSLVTGLDINELEISQACRVFDKENLDFIYDTFNEDTFQDEKFDVIVFAASLQYFPSAKAIIELALSQLNGSGEVHIMDTHFYKPEEVKKAYARTRNYYNSLGYPQMAEQYFHHSIDELSGLKHHILLNPDSILNLLGTRGPFHWITIDQ